MEKNMKKNIYRYNWITALQQKLTPCKSTVHKWKSFKIFLKGKKKTHKKPRGFPGSPEVKTVLSLLGPRSVLAGEPRSQKLCSLAKTKQQQQKPELKMRWNKWRLDAERRAGNFLLWEMDSVSLQWLPWQVPRSGWLVCVRAQSLQS